MGWEEKIGVGVGWVGGVGEWGLVGRVDGWGLVSRVLFRVLTVSCHHGLLDITVTYFVCYQNCYS